MTLSLLSHNNDKAPRLPRRLTSVGNPSQSSQASDRARPKTATVKRTFRKFRTRTTPRTPGCYVGFITKKYVRTILLSFFVGMGREAKKARKSYRKTEKKKKRVLNTNVPSPGALLQSQKILKMKQKNEVCCFTIDTMMVSSGIQ